MQNHRTRIRVNFVSWHFGGLAVVFGCESCFLAVGPSFLAVWPSFFWEVDGSWFLVVKLWCLMVVLGPLWAAHPACELEPSIIVVRHVALSLCRCGRTAAHYGSLIFVFSERTTSIHSLLLLRGQTPETRGQRGPLNKVPRHGDEVPRQWKGQLPCHSTQGGHMLRSRWADPSVLSSIARPEYVAQ